MLSSDKDQLMCFADLLRTNLIHLKMNQNHFLDHMNCNSNVESKRPDYLDSCECLDHFDLLEHLYLLDLDLLEIVDQVVGLWGRA